MNLHQFTYLNRPNRYINREISVKNIVLLCFIGYEGMSIFCVALSFIYIPCHRQFYILWITVITIAYEAMSFLYLVNHWQIIQKHSFKVLYLMKHCDFYTLWHTEMFICYEALLILYVVMHCIFGTEYAKKVPYVLYHRLYLMNHDVYIVNHRLLYNFWYKVFSIA